MEIALHTTLRPGAGPAYDELHRTIPPAVAAKLRAAGVQDWRIWRDGVDVFHLVDVEDYQALRDALRDDPDNLAWQTTVGPLFDQPDDYAGDDSGISLLWTLADQLGDQTGDQRADSPPAAGD